MNDFDEAAKDFYIAYYGSNIDKNRWEYNHKGNRIEVRGDICFNFNTGNLYGSIIKGEERINNIISVLNELRYSPMNISIMPKTGGLNNIKQNIGNDRFDTFACLLDQYYKGNKVPVINAGAVKMSIENRKSLSEFLDSYVSVYEYFEDFYGVDKAFTDRLINNGKQLITERKDFLDYISLAVDFWLSRMNTEKMKKCPEYIKYNEHINQLKNLIDKQTT